MAFTGRRAAGEERGEFLASTDNWFRPVQVRTGPDGALYVVDMYRFVIEHARWIPPERLKQLDVRAGADMGRIYRVYPKGIKPQPIRDLTKLDDAQLASALDTPNGPTRDLSHLELQSRAGVSPAPRGTTAASSATPRTNGTGETPALLSRLATNAPLPAVRAQAIACLENLNLISADVIQTAFMDPDPGVRRLAIRAAEPLLRKGAVRLPETDRDSSVRFQLALSLGEWPDRAAGEQLGKLAGPDDPWVRAAVLSSAALHSVAVFKSVLAEQGKIDGPFAGQLISIAGHSPRALDWQELLRAITPAKQTPAEPWQWRALASLMDALDRNHITALALSTSSWEESREAADRIWQSLAGARALAANDKLDDATREAGIRLLGRGEGDRAADLAVLAGFLQAGNAPRLQAAAIESFRRQRGPQLAEVTLTNWNQTTPTARVALMNLLVSRDEWIAVLLATPRASKASLTAWEHAEPPVMAYLTFLKSWLEKAGSSTSL